MVKITKQYTTGKASLSTSTCRNRQGRAPQVRGGDRAARRIKKGDQRALEKLTKANLRFVVSVAKQYQNQGLSLETSS